ncbi:0aaaccc9-7bc1-4b98-815f-157b89e1b455 [Thermothielavioides terrestris]|uniref:0aaaccc9-7bc1-4b98-815f-157b89e1b455 n=1 Tax=Thermothielavioides terrestris TaxID=2587410 RepID=A0A3S4ANQ6_9PEZI|nr:0aaaccc9-7bc1-4b98-815f-157b89e1b455 [Thermothielavioides terrestris]
MEKIQLLLRALQLLFIVILTGLVGNIIASNIAAASSATAAINFSMFVVVLSWLAALLGLATAVIERVALAPLVLLGADVLATLFTFIDAVVLAAKLRAVNCADTGGQPANWIAYGSADDGKRCREVQASTVFMWFLFATFAAVLALGFLGFRRGGGSIRSGPTMSQVRV